LSKPASLAGGATRRDFLTAGAAAASLAALAPAVHAAGSDILKIGLIGCGGRGTGAAEQALNADPNVRLTAVGDMFADHLQNKLKLLRANDKVGSRVQVDPQNCFTGFDAYKGVIGSGVDVVLLTTPPHFRPLHLKAAIDAGKHVFCEKPVAVDAPGVRKVLAACKEAKRKNLAVVSGLCWRYHHAKQETFRRIHDGAIGDIVAMQCSYLTGPLWHVDRTPAMSDMEWQLRNWLYFTWLSGDHIVEQHIHSLDKMMWAMKDVPPARASGTGGRQVRTGPEFGHIYDHFAIVYEWANGVKAFGRCRQQGTVKPPPRVKGTRPEVGRIAIAYDVNDYLMGTEGTCDVMKHNITGKKPWHYKAPAGDPDDMYQNEHNALFASIRNGKPINDGEWMSQSTLLAIMGRMAAYTGQVITWEMALNSKEDLTPAAYEMGPLPVPPVAMPGKTPFV
jgi:predicted dehydrogenase